MGGDFEMKIWGMRWKKCGNLIIKFGFVNKIEENFNKFLKFKFLAGKILRYTWKTFFFKTN